MAHLPTRPDPRPTEDVTFDPAQTLTEEDRGGAEKKKKEKFTLADALYEWLQSLACAVIFIVVMFLAVGRIIYVDGNSMNPTLLNGDMMLVQEIGYTPRQGDVVVLTKDTFLSQPIVKRVIAVGGQMVDINYQDGTVLVDGQVVDKTTVMVDGQVLDEPYIKEPMVKPSSTMMGNEHVLVPEGSIYVMGDNRNNSSDSRWSTLGTVDVRYVIGRAVCVVMPLEHMGLIH